MRICFVCNEYPPLPHGGIGIFVQTLAETLVKLGVEVWVMGFGRKRPAPFKQNGVWVQWLTLPHPLYRSIKLGRYPHSIAGLIKRHFLTLHLNRLVRQQQISIIESPDFGGSLAYKPLSKLIVRLHNSVVVMRKYEGRPDDINPIDRYFERKQVAFADHIVAVSEHIAGATREVMGLEFDYQVIYNGVDTDFFHPQSDKIDPNRVLFVGNIMWRKGIFDLLRAAPYLVEHCPEVKITIAGGAGGAHQQQLDAELASLPLTIQACFEFVGRLEHSQLNDLYNRAAVFVFPSRVEAFGLTCAEAMACGRPVVVTSLASGPELIDDGVSGLLADPRNPAELGEKIVTLLKDPQRAQQYGEKARQRVLERFSLQDLGTRNLAYYHSLFP